jgi:SEC-C motif
MTDRRLGLIDIIDSRAADRWTKDRGRLSRLFQSIGLTEGQHSQALYIMSKHPLDVQSYIKELLSTPSDPEQWGVLVGSQGDRSTVIAFPTSTRLRLKGLGASKVIRQTTLALFIEIHSKFVSWWLVNAWRSRQLADATWQLSDPLQIIAAAACARSLVETAASMWVDTRKARETWDDAKRDCVKNGPSIEHRDKLAMEVNCFLWGSKFDDKAPNLKKTFGIVPRTNVLSQVEKLARATNCPLQEDYQWLCNAVHPSVGGLLAFAAPMQGHDTGSHAFQWVCEIPMVFKQIEMNGGKYNLLTTTGTSSASPFVPEARETTLADAVARSACLAVEVLERTLNDALKLVDDIGLTTSAPFMASFPYWRNVSRQSGNALCPCRSGKKAKHCLHRWSDPAPTICSRFDMQQVASDPSKAAKS